MKTKEVETVTNTLRELNESYSDFLNALKGTVKEVKATRKLWRAGNKSRLIKLGLTLITLPEPTPISETVGTCFVAAGVIQKAIQNRSIYNEDVNKTFQKIMKDLWTTQQSLLI